MIVPNEDVENDREHRLNLILTQHRDTPEEKPTHLASILRRHFEVKTTCEGRARGREGHVIDEQLNCTVCESNRVATLLSMKDDDDEGKERMLTYRYVACSGASVPQVQLPPVHPWQCIERPARHSA